MLDTLVIDFETFYTREYSLSKMTTQEYVLSEYFEIILVSVKRNDEPTVWFSGTGEATKTWLMQFDWANSRAIAHNALFDGAILEWVLGIHPKEWFCTMNGARPLAVPFTPRGRVSLAVLSEYYKVGTKGTEVVNAIGFRRRDFSSEQLKRYADYCCGDSELTYKIYLLEVKHLPTGEQALIHETVRKFTRPVLRLNREVLVAQLAKVQSQKLAVLQDAGLNDNKVLMSNPQFAEALENLGVSPPMKLSPTTGKETFAFAKTDQGMRDLQEHEDFRVQALVAARLKHKSTQEETRLERFLAITALPGGAPLGVPLKYYGAHTGRFSGCLTADNYVTILDGTRVAEVRINEVKDHHRVWDGVEFVQHEGLKCSGYREVIHYHGITGTPCHPVLVRGEQPWYKSLADAQADGDDLTPGNAPTQLGVQATMSRSGDYNRPSSYQVPGVRRGNALKGERRFSQTSSEVQKLLDDRAWVSRGRKPARISSGCGRRKAKDLVARVRYTRKRVQNIKTLGGRSKTAVLQQEPRGVQELRRQGDRVQVCFKHRSNAVGLGEFRSSPKRQVAGPYRQQWALRSGESTLGHSPATSRQPQGLQRVAQTYDIVNCGPRHRFVANGYIVHNSDGLNLQNLPRGGELRRAVEAPPGYILIAGDLSQIEARITAVLAGQHDLVAAYAAGRDVYCDFGTETVFHRTITKDDVKERFICKTAILGLGFGLGAEVYKAALAGSAMNIVITSKEAQRIVWDYRKRYAEIPKLWHVLDTALQVMVSEGMMQVGPLTFCKEHVRLPNGMSIFYPWLGLEHSGMHFTYRGSRKSIWGGALCENVVQALARIILGIAETRLAKRGLHSQLQVHDELIYCVKLEHAEMVKKALRVALQAKVAFMPTLPVACEVKVGYNYLEMKEEK